MYLITYTCDKPLRGQVEAAPDKSISHRAVILAALTEGTSVINNLLLSDDVKCTLAWAEQHGCVFEWQDNLAHEEWLIFLEALRGIEKRKLDRWLKQKKLGIPKEFYDSTGLLGCQAYEKSEDTESLSLSQLRENLLGSIGRLARANLSIHCPGLSARQSSVKNNKSCIVSYLGNSGTSARLLLGVASGLKIPHLFFGDSSLESRPMLRVLNPLNNRGARFWTSEKERNEIQFQSLQVCSLNNTTSGSSLPVLTVPSSLKNIKYTLPVASAQVKSALLLSGLFTEEETTILEPIPTRDHTENMLREAGIDIIVQHSVMGVSASPLKSASNSAQITLASGVKKLQPREWKVPGDISSASFLIVAALLIPGSDIIINKVNLNPRRSGILKVLKHMNAKIEVTPRGSCAGEVYGDLRVVYSGEELRPCCTDAALAPSMIDEFPVLFCLAATIKGVSSFHGIKELIYKESNRLAVMAHHLNDLGVRCEASEDSLTVYGGTLTSTSQATVEIDAKLDHRVALSFAVLGLITPFKIKIKGAEAIFTSFPNFIEQIRALGGMLRTE